MFKDVIYYLCELGYGSIIITDMNLQHLVEEKKHLIIS
jgi:hypothetical protein